MSKSWFLKQIESKRQPWEDLQAIQTEPQFVQLMKDLRETNEMRNDDVTMMLIQPDNS